MLWSPPRLLWLLRFDMEGFVRCVRGLAGVPRTFGVAPETIGGASQTFGDATSGDRGSDNSPSRCDRCCIVSFTLGGAFRLTVGREQGEFSLRAVRISLLSRKLRAATGGMGVAIKVARGAVHLTLLPLALVWST